jgi:hypothetical protein
MLISQSLHGNFVWDPVFEIVKVDVLWDVLFISN